MEIMKIHRFGMKLTTKSLRKISNGSTYKGGDFDVGISYMS